MLRCQCAAVAGVAVLLSATSVLAQRPADVDGDGMSVVRHRFCTINPGYTMRDVVATARASEWSEESAPSLVVFRSRIATNAGANFDFIGDFVYPSYADMVEKRGAFLRWQAETDGRRVLDGVATCSDNVLIQTARVANVVNGTVQPQFPVLTTACELNGAPISDLVDGATMFGNARGASSFVNVPTFGGRQRALGSTALMLLAFPSWADFGTSWDQLSQTQPAGDPQNPVSCNVPRLWGAWRVHPE
ncbi:MAG: hypothetical protein VX453_01185 [Acidobacteriota bacterium]|nr:hypothetical protein [Acidobacteriota bacterium]